MSADSIPHRGALGHLKVVEFGGLGPAPFCSMLLADMGAEVIRIDRPDSVGRDPMEPRFNTMLRGRRNIALDLKKTAGVDAALRLCDQANILIEGFRPGVMERLGLGPDVVMARRPSMIYGRMTGWGQTGPLAQAPGHDINYVALTGALHAIGPAERPVPPLALVGDMGGGGLYLAVGVLAAYIESLRSGHGQVVDAAVLDGTCSLMTAFFGMLAAGTFVERRASNRLDGGSHFYNAYQTADGEFISLASNEPEFYERLLNALNLDFDSSTQNQRELWARHRDQLAAIFKQKTRDEWARLLEPQDLCFSPVLKMSEAPSHPQNVARALFIEVADVVQPAPAPKLSRTPAAVTQPPAHIGEHTCQVLKDWNFHDQEIDALVRSGAARQRQAAQSMQSRQPR